MEPLMKSVEPFCPIQNWRPLLIGKRSNCPLIEIWLIYSRSPVQNSNKVLILLISGYVLAYGIIYCIKHVLGLFFYLMLFAFGAGFEFRVSTKVGKNSTRELLSQPTKVIFPTNVFFHCISMEKEYWSHRVDPETI